MLYRGVKKKRERRAYKSQFIYDGTHADTTPLRLSPDDIARFNIIARYPYLPTNWIRALAGGHEQRNRTRLARLARAPHAYFERRQEWYKHACYHLTDKGYAAINATPEISRDPFAHHVLQSLIEASFAIESKKIQLLTWDDILASGIVPLAAQTSITIPLARARLKPDGRPIALKGRKRNLYLLKEIDRATEPLTSAAARRTITEKLSHYREFMKRTLYTKHFGFPNCMVLFITTSEARMHGMMQLAKKEIEDASLYRTDNLVIDIFIPLPHHLQISTDGAACLFQWDKSPLPLHLRHIYGWCNWCRRTHRSRRHRLKLSRYPGSCIRRTRRSPELTGVRRRSVRLDRFSTTRCATRSGLICLARRLVGAQAPCVIPTARGRARSGGTGFSRRSLSASARGCGVRAR